MSTDTLNDAPQAPMAASRSTDEQELPMSQMPLDQMDPKDRFIEVPQTMLPADTRRALLETFVTRQGYDTTDVGEGMAGWVAELEGQLSRGKLLIVHDIGTESTEVMTLEQWQSFGRQLADDEEEGD
jgi:uncharacterized protein YheU (UPF0270 family)